MANNRPYTYNSPKKKSVKQMRPATSTGYGRVYNTNLSWQVKPSKRENLRDVESIRYGSPTWLSADRVEQVFDFYIDREFYYTDSVADEAEVHLVESQVEHDEDEIQLSLPLENVDEVEAQLVRAIRKYRNATENMAICALSWWNLMEDIRENDLLREEFEKFQMLRSLSGGRT